MRTWRAACEQDGSPTEAEVRAALADLDRIWAELFPAKQARIVRLLVQQVEVNPDRLDIRFRAEGLASLTDELWAAPIPEREAACAR